MNCGCLSCWSNWTKVYQPSLPSWYLVELLYPFGWDESLEVFSFGEVILIVPPFTTALESSSRRVRFKESAVSTDTLLSSALDLSSLSSIFLSEFSAVAFTTEFVVDSADNGWISLLFSEPWYSLESIPGITAGAS